MAMKAPTPPVSPNHSAGILPPTRTTSPKIDIPAGQNSATLCSMDELDASGIYVPRLMKIMSEPMSEFSLEPRESLTTGSGMTIPKLGISKSEDTAEEHYNEDELVEHTFGSVSPIFVQNTARSSSSGRAAAAAARAANMRLKFRKSHTCGSLFAKCNCSGSSPTNNTPAKAAGQAVNAFHQSISPTNYLEARSGSGSTALITTPSSSLSLSQSTRQSQANTSSGISSLSTQTSSATSAQLSHDESISFDYGPVGLIGAAASAAAALAETVSVERFQPRQQLSFEHSTPHNDRGAVSASSPQQLQQTHQSHATLKSNLKVPRICKQNSAEAPSSAAAATRSERSSKSRRLLQSYSHPDTDFIFTFENRISSSPRESHLSVPGYRGSPPAHSAAGSDFKHPKRSSSPNIGQYQILDIAVHPDFLVRVSPKHSPLSEHRRLCSSPTAAATTAAYSSSSPRSAQQKRRLLQRSHEIVSEGSTSGSDQSFDIQIAKSPGNSQSVEQHEAYYAGIVKPKAQFALTTAVTSASSNSSAAATSSTTTAATIVSQPADSSTAFNAAQKYFAESGILGPINTSSNLIRKTSKILQDSNVIEQIRKTSMILRGNLTGGSKNTSPTLESKSKRALTPPESLKLKSALPANLSLLGNVSMETPASIIYSPSSPKSPHTMATTCGFSPNVTTQSCIATDDRDAQIKSLQGENVSLKDVIKSRDAEIVKLRREIHKLKSVLQQTTNHLPIANDDLLQSPPAALSNRCFLTPPAQQQCSEISSSSSAGNSLPPLLCTQCKKELGRSSLDATIGQQQELPPPFKLVCSAPQTSNGTTSVTCALVSDEGLNGEPATAAVVQQLTAAASAELSEELVQAKAKLLQTPVLKKQGVSGESCETSMQLSINVPIATYDKDFSSKQLIKEAIMDNDFLKNIDASQVRELVESMYSLAVAQGEFVIREGEVGAHLYVSAEGEFEVVKNGKVLGIMGAGKAFGELAILYNCTRTASIRVLSDARLWVLDRRVFQQIMMRTGMQRIENSVNFLKSVPLLKNLSDEVLAKIADVLEVEFYPAGTYIIRQGASGDTFFLISQGSVKVTQKLTPSADEKEIRTLQPGDYFGEQALINEDKRTANIIAMAPGVECLTLDRDSFTHLIGDLCELKEKNYGDENRVLAMKYAEKTKDVFGSNVRQEFPELNLTDLEVIATLGIGGFGRVELVKAYRENSVDIFALKCLKKKHIVDTKQEEHIFSERTIMLSCNSPFICRLYRTFRDSKYVYMLLEACMGGEIWTMLRDRRCFDENATQFIIGCVLQAFEYLHSRGIIYRDLKPENLMLDERGYVKLVDFGFSKYIGNSSKTWTFCGTPEYVAPEIILNKGHDRAVDYWALGILIHELLNGTPPFTDSDPMKTYNIILKGIDMVNFPKHMSRSAVQLIKRLCRDVPAERLGYQKGGIQDIKKHKWFLGFDWDGLASQLLIPPFVRPIAHPTDTCYFDKFPCDPEEPPDEFSGWDADF